MIQDGLVASEGLGWCGVVWYGMVWLGIICYDFQLNVHHYIQVEFLVQCLDAFTPFTGMVGFA